jgi:undecaprenyl-diphosphatase
VHLAAVLKMVLLGIVQGVTEFLPVSSTGHLTIIQEAVKIEGNRVLFDVFLHIGTLAAILMVFAKDVVALFSSNKRWIPYVVVACLPAAAVGLAAGSAIRSLFHSIAAVGGLLMCNGLVLALGSMAGRRRELSAEVAMKPALVVGVAQSIALLPGISRSGSTICSGLIMGWERRLAVRFSFLLAIPATVGAAVYEAAKCRSVLASGDVLVMALVGVVVSAGVGYVALRILVKAVLGGKLWVFAGYCFAVGAGLLLYGLVT